jgi:hypothetical protein
MATGYPDDTVADQPALTRLVADFGSGFVEGVWRGLQFRLHEERDNAGGILVAGMVVSPLWVALASGRGSDRAGAFLLVELPANLMADLLLESAEDDGAPADDPDPMAHFVWSGTSEEYVERCLRGPLLELLTEQARERSVRMTDDQLLIGPMPREPSTCAAMIDRIICTINEHFEQLRLDD